MLSPFSFATESELDHITALVNALRQARAETQRIREALVATDDKLRDVPWARARDLAAAAARALGEQTATAAVVERPRIDVTELREQKEGLQRRLNSAEESEKSAQNTLRSGIHDLLYRCAQRAGDRYAQLAAELGQHWQLIYTMETMVGSLQNPVAPLSGWMSLKIPASEFIEAHKRELRYEWHAPLLASSDRFGTDPQKLSREVAAEGRRLFGEWPL
jgi:hypothetical protein